MFTQAPQTSEEFEVLPWEKIEPWYREVLNTPLTPETLQTWLQQWSHLSALVDETIMRFEIATTQNTADTELVQRKQRFMEEIYGPVQVLNQQIKVQLLTSELEPAGFTMQLRNLRTETALYREENLPLLNADKALTDNYMKMGGTQTVEWEGKEISIIALYPVLRDLKRDKREQAWRAMQERRRVDTKKIDTLWIKKLQLRQQIAHNAGYKNYRDYRWQQMFRFDYTPTDCQNFHQAVEKVIVPVASQLWESHRQRLGVEKLQPWDMAVNSRASVAPRAITDVDGLLKQCAGVFQLLDPQLGSYFETMLEKQMFDLEERPDKAHGGYNLPLEVKHLPFIFGHVNSITDIMSLIFHEAGHAFHVFEAASLPYIQQRQENAVPIEFAEVASTSMEFIGGMYLEQAGLCTAQEANLLRLKHIEATITSDLPMIVRGDAFQHWVYDNLEQALDPDQCRQKWAELTQRYLPAIEGSGLEEELSNGWQWILHFFTDPFYYIEYAFATIGAFQVWHNYLQDPQKALQQYRTALSLGATKTVPELYAAAGAKFAFNEEILQLILQLTTQTVEELSRKL